MISPVLVAGLSKSWLYDGCGQKVMMSCIRSDSALSSSHGTRRLLLLTCTNPNFSIVIPQWYDICQGHSGFAVSALPVLYTGVPVAVSCMLVQIFAGAICCLEALFDLQLVTCHINKSISQ